MNDNMKQDERTLWNNLQMENGKKIDIKWIIDELTVFIIITATRERGGI